MHSFARLVGLVVVAFPLLSGNATRELTDGLVVHYSFNGNANDVVGNAQGTGLQSVETLRQGTPPNQDAYQRGVTSGPVIGATWDPFIDHTLFAPRAIMDFMLITEGPANLPVFPGTLGTLLCDVTQDYLFLVVNQAAAGSPFLIELPADNNLVGAEFCTQGGSLVPPNAIQLTNAIDIVIGTF